MSQKFKVKGAPAPLLSYLGKLFRLVSALALQGPICACADNIKAIKENHDLKRKNKKT